MTDNGHRGLLVLPRLRVQNANGISSSMTWGFPAITHFTGLMTALERRLGTQEGIVFLGVGVICHKFEAQVTQEGYTRAFHLARHPIKPNRKTASGDRVASIVEEGRIHLDLTLVFEVEFADARSAPIAREALAVRVLDQLGCLRIAGGSLLPMTRPRRPTLDFFPDTPEDFRRLCRRWLPGFALVSRDDLLQGRLAERREVDPTASTLDAWLDFVRWTRRAVEHPSSEDGPTSVEWLTDRRPGWLVPIPVGYASLSELYPGGRVAHARDETAQFQFVETIWSIGQWVSPHRMRTADDVLWYPEDDEIEATTDQSMPRRRYRCFNNFTPDRV